MDPSEWEELKEIVARLDGQRPVPSPGFRGRLGRDLIGEPPTPRRPRLLVAAYAGSGCLLLAVAGIGLAGLGPLAPS